MYVPNAEISFLDAAARIASRLCRDAIWHERQCNWLGASMEPVEGTWQIVQRSFGGDLYSGTAGIALFLARLYRQAPDPLLARTIEGALRQALSRARDLPPTSRLGFYTGAVGIAYAATEWAEISGDERWANEARDLLRFASAEDSTGPVLDVVAGLAGAIPPLLDLAHRLEAPQLRDLASRLGDNLLTAAHQRPEGWSWDTLGNKGAELRDHLLGFSHGASGVAWALLELHAATGEDRFRQGAVEGQRYESHWFNPRVENWPDLRGNPHSINGQSNDGQSGEEALSYPTQWCHGAPGIGLARLRAYELLGDPQYRREAEAAIRTTLPTLDPSEGPTTAGAITNDSLCHGRSGNAELLLHAASVLDEPTYLAIAREVGRRGIATFEATGRPWPSGLRGGEATPGLMLGLAGTGYFLLRLANPEATPSIVIATPRSTAMEASIATPPSEGRGESRRESRRLIRIS